MFYPKSLLKKIAADGGDVSGLPVITGTYSDPASFSARGLMNDNSQWDERDPTDNRIIIPYSFHRTYPQEQKFDVILALRKMNDELGCIETKWIDSLSYPDQPASYTNGILFIFEDVSGTPKSCYSALGKSPGYVGKTGASSIVDLGAPAGWQVIALGTLPISGCDGSSEQAIHHEMLHALGFLQGLY